MLKKKKKETVVKPKYVKGFLKPEIAGYYDEIHVIRTRNGCYFSVFEVLMDHFDRSDVNGIIGKDGFRYAIYARLGKVYIAIGAEADVVDEFFENLHPFLANPSLRVLSIREWAELVAVDVTGTGLIVPEKEKRALSHLIRPFGLDAQKQNVMKISGKTVKTCILYQIPSRIFAAFGSELLALGPEYSLAVHLEKIDPAVCLKNLAGCKTLSAGRKIRMEQFLEKAVQKEESVYNVCALVRIDGTEDSIGTLFERLERFCKKYLLNVSELDYQQYIAYKSTLPLMVNHIKYNRVMTGENLMAILPWSRLSDLKKDGILYGDDIISGPVHYDRYKDRESGFILSTDMSWEKLQFDKERERFDPHHLSLVLQTEDRIFLEEVSPVETKIRLSDLPDWLIRSIVLGWAKKCLSVNGKLKPEYNQLLLVARECLLEGSDYYERFLEFAQKNPNALRALRVRPLPESYPVSVDFHDQKGCTTVTVRETDEFLKKVTYAAAFELFSRTAEKVYSISSEYLSDGFSKELNGRIYTYFSGNLSVFYEDPEFKKKIRDSRFLLLGEHQIREKLALCNAFFLDKSLRDWISQPAKGAVLVTEHVMYQLKKEGDRSDE